MANLSINNYAVKSATKNVLNFVNEGLKNSGIEPKDNIKDAVETLWGNKVYMSTFKPIPETFLKLDTTNDKKSKDAVDRDTKESFFKSGEEYENYSREYDEAVKFQKMAYGTVGLVAYNCLIGFGTKWDTEVELEGFSIDDEEGTATIFMKGKTPSCYPELWLEYIKETFNLNVFLCTKEEFGEYNFAKEIGGKIIGGYDGITSFENCPKEDDFNDEEEYMDALNDFQDDVNECLYSMYYDYVKSYDINENSSEEVAA